MARKTVTLMNCDRCNRTIEETPEVVIEDGAAAGADAVDVDNIPLQVYVECEGQEIIEFKDLCPKCKERCSSLVTQIRLEKDEKKTKAKKPANGANGKTSGKDKKKIKKKTSGKDKKATPDNKNTSSENENDF